MDPVPFGPSDESVSPMSLGCMYFGTKVDAATSFRLLDQYVDAGGTFLDTANCYAFWVDDFVGDESEALLGRWMQARRNRDDLFLASKVGSRPSFVGGTWPEDAEGLSAPVVRDAVEASLERLQTDRLDLCYAHIDDRSTPLDETLAVFAELVDEGKIRHLGCSNIATWRVEQARRIGAANGWPSYVCVQQKYTYLQPHPSADFGAQVFVNRELLDYCAQDDGPTLLAYSPLLSGAYTRDDRPIPDAFGGSGNDARMDALRDVARDVGATMNQVVLAWMMQGTPRIIPLVAGSTSEQLAENLDARHVVLSEAHLDRLNAAGQPVAA